LSWKLKQFKSFIKFFFKSLTDEILTFSF